ncbi:TPA: 50S ribosomal protein L6 [candidate division WOR-3 bacterium]|uniref:50S ribosomal protein L6 n=1 Tax=candidate division WOR-3 bacterium TaxID=2052148 RepID=A0A350H7Q9_UNCW3|nr:50S ribosomal protein L6 [candidate division WOR-3 bacterium]
MSRLGKMPVHIPDGVNVILKDNMISVKGPKGELIRNFPEKVAVKIEDKKIIVDRNDDTKTSNMNQGLLRSLINNMVIGVTQGYMKELILEAREYKAQMEGTSLKLSLGFSHPVIMKAPEGIKFEAPEEKRVVISGRDKELVGQVTANIKKLRKWEPYVSKGIKFKGEKARKKERKTGV